MQEFILTLVVAFILFRVFRTNVTVYNFNGQQPNQHKQSPPQQKPEGKITIDKQPFSTKKKNNDDEGEYVDYVEIK
jgi:hypothetical protein